MQTLRAMLMALVVAGVMPAAADASGQAGSSAPKLSGSIASLNLNAQPPTMRLLDLQGRQVTVTLDPAAEVRENGRAARLEGLRIGQQVEVEQVSRDGQQVATEIEIMNGRPGAATQPDKPGAAAPEAPASSNPSTGTRQPQY